METTTLYGALNKEARIFGLKTVGIIFALIVALSVWLFINETAAVFAAVLGYHAGAYVSGLWHGGILQRRAYRYLPLAGIIGNKYLPPSHLCRFM